MENKKNIWIDNVLLFKKYKSYAGQSIYICAESYKNELKIEVGDILFLKNQKK